MSSFRASWKDMTDDPQLARSQDHMKTVEAFIEGMWLTAGEAERELIHQMHAQLVMAHSGVYEYLRSKLITPNGKIEEVK